MKRVDRNDMLPRPIQILGILTEEMKNRMAEVRRDIAGLNTDLANIMAIPPEVWECASVEEVGREAHLDDCEIQVLRDRKNNRYYFCAMSVDPGRTKARIEDTEAGVTVVEDEGPFSPMVLYYCEITRAEFRRWQKEDRGRHREIEEDDVEES